MPINIQISVDLGPRQKRVFRAALVAGGVIGSLGLGIVVAAPAHTFTAGTPISASQMNDNFVDLDSRVVTLQTQVTNVRAVSVIVGTAASPCTTGTCTLTPSVPAGITTVTGAGNGDYVIVFTAGALGTQPICVANAIDGDNTSVQAINVSATQVTVRVRANATGTLISSAFSLICQRGV